MPRGERGGGSVKKTNSPKANFFLDTDGGEAPSYPNNHEKKPRNARQLLQKHAPRSGACDAIYKKTRLSRIVIGPKTN